jgi:glycyl-tRNA synthetase beta subunit
MSTHSKPKTKRISQESVENGGNSLTGQLSSLSKDAIRSMWEDFFKASAKQTLPEQLLAKKEKKASSSHEHENILQMGQEMNLLGDSVPEKAREVTSAHYEHVRSLNTPERSTQRESSETEQQVTMLQNEIKKLIKASKEMETAFKQVSTQVTVEQTKENMGTYHVNFLEWVLVTIRNARMRVEEGQSWMRMFASKKSQNQYWNQFKSKGTSFSLSSERSTATQTG